MTLLGFWGFVSSNSMRVNLSLAIVEMVSTSTGGGLDSFSNSSSYSSPASACPSLQSDALLLKGNETWRNSEGREEFYWDSADQGLILGSFFWGYVISQVPGGLLAERFGGKWPFGIGMLITALFTLLTPWAARQGKEVLILLRIIQGLGEVRSILCLTICMDIQYLYISISASQVVYGHFNFNRYRI
jgi:ACS family sodium-dependent inorganic phosphate cotransporter-like MFS transporter 5